MQNSAQIGRGGTRPSRKHHNGVISALGGTTSASSGFVLQETQRNPISSVNLRALCEKRIGSSPRWGRMGGGAPSGRALPRTMRALKKVNGTGMRPSDGRFVVEIGRGIDSVSLVQSEWEAYATVVWEFEAGGRVRGMGSKSTCTPGTSFQVGGGRTWAPTRTSRWGQLFAFPHPGGEHSACSCEASLISTQCLRDRHPGQPGLSGDLRWPEVSGRDDRSDQPAVSLAGCLDRLPICAAQPDR